MLVKNNSGNIEQP